MSAQPSAMELAVEITSLVGHLGLALDLEPMVQELERYSARQLMTEVATALNPRASLTPEEHQDARRH